MLLFFCWVFFFVLEYLAIIGFHWMESFPSMKLKNGSDIKWSSKGVKFQLEVNCPFKRLVPPLFFVSEVYPSLLLNNKF